MDRAANVGRKIGATPSVNNRLRNLVQLRDKQGHVSLYLLKKVTEEGKELQRALYFYGIDKHWTEFINGDY